MTDKFQPYLKRLEARIPNVGFLEKRALEQCCNLRGRRVSVDSFANTNKI